MDDNNNPSNQPPPEEGADGQPAPVQPQASEPALPVSQAPNTDNSASAPPGNTESRSAPASIYPEATKGFGISVPPPQPSAPLEAPTLQDVKKTKLINVLIQILGAYIAVTALLGLIGGLKAASIGFAGSGTVIIIFDVIYLFLGIGISLKNEIARVLYIVLAVIGLAISIYGTYHYFSDISKQNQAASVSKIQAEDQKTIENYQNNSSIPASQRTQIIQELKQDEARDIANAKITQQNLNKANQKVLVVVIEGYALALIPLIFLTRPSVKAQFE